MEDSTKKRVFFYTKSDKKTGYGHFIRQSILYEYLKKKKINCYFLKDDIDKKLAKHLNLKVTNFNLNSFIGSEKLHENGILIIDRYDITEKLQKKISEKIKFLIFDNLKSLASKYIYSDIIINIDQSIKKKKYLKRSRNKKINLLIGDKYSIVRKNNLNFKTKEYDYLILLGGGDNMKNIKNLIFQLQNRVKNKKFLVISGFIDKNFKIKAFNSNRVFVKKNVKNPLNYMASSKSLICAGGTVLLESLQFNINRHVVITAKNQVSMSMYYYKQKYFSNLCFLYKYNKFSNRFINNIVKIKNKNRNKMIKRFKGEQLIYNEILKVLD